MWSPHCGLDVLSVVNAVTGSGMGSAACMGGLGQQATSPYVQAHENPRRVCAAMRGSAHAQRGRVHQRLCRTRDGAENQPTRRVGVGRTVPICGGSVAALGRAAASVQAFLTNAGTFTNHTLRSARLVSSDEPTASAIAATTPAPRPACPTPCVPDACPSPAVRGAAAHSSLRPQPSPPQPLSSAQRLAGRGGCPPDCDGTC